MKSRVPLILMAVLVARCSSRTGTKGDAGAGQDANAAPEVAPDVSSDVEPDGSTATDAARPRTDAMVVIGGPGCGLAAAAFCDTFDAPSTQQGRGGELDSRYWSASRLDTLGLGQFGNTNPAPSAFALPGATLRTVQVLNGTNSSLPDCRAGLPAQVLPDQDTLICDPSDDIHSGYLLTAVAAQNYGENSYRIRQPFDFAGRTGKVVFASDAFTLGGLWGYISVDLTEDPIPAPGYSDGLHAAQPFNNEEGSALPRNGLEVVINNTCGSSYTQVGVGAVHVFNDYEDTITVTDGQGAHPRTACVPVAWGKLNHFEIDVSQTEVAVYASPPSADGATFGAQELLYRGAANLPFGRGYVHITGHNHAVEKYTSNDHAPQDGFSNLDSWIFRWDSVGFDGPVISDWREYEVADPLTPVSVTLNDHVTVIHGVNTGWILSDVSKNLPAVMTLHHVDPAHATRARLAFNSQYNTNAAGLAGISLQYRFNGGSWHEQMFSAAEIRFLTSGASQGALAQILDVPVSDLVTGDNILEFAAAHLVESNYPPGVVNVDLVLTTE
ncbi:MAG: hypothetical protein ABJA82_10535 [Myxococcales bacterium]